ncbi:phosphoglycerate mutase (2,3-diphosphoglycerate-independent) [Gammaproteobacteria bacterium 53_120_T64]|nr:phosphoglycerate mutase (2,3-diphosphoglycerate-independent) [Gammaproteobacteria bacterium 53_120_T64]
MTETQKAPLVLLILDGWGYSEATEANAIYSAKSPVWDQLWQREAKTLVHCSGERVGLPAGQMGNSEVGHMTLGAGRVVYQNLSRINKAIDDGSFLANPAYCSAIDQAVDGDKKLHIFGLLSPGGVHSHEDHLLALLDMAAQRGAKQVYLHAFLDGRDTPPRSAKASLEKVTAKFSELGIGRTASVSGRYFAMDRDQRWDRIEPVYRLLTEGKAEYHSANALAALAQAYERNENDEFVSPTQIGAEGESPVSIDDGDSIIFINFRPDRARQLTRVFIDANFSEFPRPAHPQLATFVSSTEYAAELKTDIAFPPQTLVNGLGEYLAAQGKTQLRIAETEKYAHVTFFFSGGREDCYPGEERTLIPSPDVATYDLQPEMSALDVTENLVAAITGGQYDVIICNFANGDMVGHTGVFEAAVQAVETLDSCVGQVLEALQGVGGDCLITADHGNVENMVDAQSGQILTSHTIDPVPLIYVGNKDLQLSDGGSLADIAPTILALMDIPRPAEMSGHSLLSSAVDVDLRTA